MPKLYPGGITIGTNLKIQQPNPVADYMVVSAKTDLTNTTILPNQFTGMTTFVVEDQNTYVLKNTGWQILGGGSTFTGGTVSGATVFTNGLSANTISANTISATTYNGYVPYNSTNPNKYISAFTGGTVTGATIFANGLSANTISATTISATNYIGLPADIYVTSGDIDRDANLINLYRNADTTVQITNVVTVIQKSKEEIWNSLIPNNSLVKGATYKVVDCDSSLYDNRNGRIFTTVYLNAIENNVLSDTGIGVFYTPKYINPDGWEIWSPLSILQVTDIVGEFQPDEPITSDNNAKGIIFGDITSGLFYITNNDWINAKNITGDVSGAQANISLLTIKQYNSGDVVFWGGTAWFVTGTFDSVAAVATDIFNLDINNFPIQQILPLNDIQYYNISYDEVKYDIANDRITYRKDKNNNIVSTTTDNITYWLGNGKYNPIKAFKWGHDFTYSGETGIGNQKIVNSYNENINFRGTGQYDIEMNNLSYQTNIYGEGTNTFQFNLYLSNSYQNSVNIVNGSSQKDIRLENESYQNNLNILNYSRQERINFENKSYQSDITITTNSRQRNIVFENNAAQYNAKFTSSYQDRVKFYNFGFDRLFANVNEANEIYTNTLVQDNSASQVIGIKNNKLVEVDVNSIGNISPIQIVNGSNLFSTGLLYTGLNSSGVTDSIFLGSNAGANTNNNSNYSNFIGWKAGYAAYNTSYSNFIGYEVGIDAYASKWSNFIGSNAGRGAYGSDSSNFLGYYAGSGAFGASSSNFLGPNAGEGASSANNSNFIGSGAGGSAGSASYSNFFGYSVGRNFGSNNVGSNNIIIGTNISLPNGATNRINLGGVLFGTGTYSAISGNPSITGQTNGRIGIGVVSPTKRLHISGETTNDSGLRLQNLTSVSPTSTGQAIGVDLSGNVVTVAGGGATFTGGTVSGATIFTNGLSASTISATTYYGLPNQQLSAVTIDGYYGTRLYPSDTSLNGFGIVKSINGAIGVNIQNTNTGNGAYAAFNVGGDNSPYLKGASFIYYGSGYYRPELQNTAGIYNNIPFSIVSLNNTDIKLKTGNEFGSETTKLSISSGGTVNISVTPTIDNTGSILGRNSSGNIILINTASITSGITATEDATGIVSGNNLPLTLATVNSNVGSFGSASLVPVITVNGKGLITAVSAATIQTQISALTLNTSGAIHSTPINFTNTAGAWSGTMSLVNQNANTVFAGPITGLATTPSFRSLVVNDIPSLVTLYLPISGGTVSGATVFTSSLSATTISATTYNGYTPLNSFNPTYTGLLSGTGVTVVTGASQTGVVDLSQTWNTTGAPTAIKLNVTNLASSNTSLLLDLEVGGNTVFSVNKFGDVGSTSNRIGQIISNRINIITNSISAAQSIVSNSFFGHSTGISRGFLNTDSFTISGGTGVFNAFEYSGVINQTGGASGITRGIYINPTLTSAADFRAIDVTGGKIFYSSTITPIGTNGAQTINRISGKVNAAAGTTSLVVTNNLVTTSSIVMCQMGTNDATARITSSVESNGFFTINYVAPTAATVIKFTVIN